MRKTLYVLGALLVFLGVVGYFQNPVLGVFALSKTLATIHLVAGLVIFGSLYKSDVYGRTASLLLGVLFLLGAVLGLVKIEGSLFGIYNVSASVNFLHIVVSIFLIGVGMHKHPMRAKNFKT